ncbi:MAG: hypothetical protein IPM34_04070 [Saprospiraceae bacterium]|nr:hypothetical protein [Saprospiraceae bacterium]
MKYTSAILTLGAMFLITACSPTLTPFTQKLYDDYKWNEEDLRRIQFYISEDIILRRKFTDGESRIQDGKIKTVRGEKVEEIIFRSGTPCVYLFSPKSNRFAISFESSDPPKYLMFGPNPKYSSRFMLLGKEWDRNTGTITYNNQNWYTTTESAVSCLLVDLQKANFTEHQSEVVKGQRVDR